MNIPPLPAPDSNRPARPLNRPAAGWLSTRPVRAMLSLMLLLASMAVFTARAGTTEPPSSAPRVIATYYPLYLIAANVMKGTDSHPSLLLEPAGGCAHGLALRPSQVATLGRADLIVETGLGLEPFLDNDRLPWKDGVVRVPLARDILESDLVQLLDDHDHGHSGHGHDDHGHDNHDAAAHDHDAHGHDEHGHDEHGHAGHDHDAEPHTVGGRDGFNGHAWSSPRLAAQMTRTLGEALASHDSGHASLYRANAAEFAGQLDALAEELAAAAEPLRGARVALSHTSLAYIARDLGLNVVVALRDEDENEPGPRGFAELIDAARSQGLDAVLYDPQDEGRLARMFAQEAGCDRVLELDPAASGPLELGAYARIMESNLAAIRAWANNSAHLAGHSRSAPQGRVASTHQHPTESSAP